MINKFEIESDKTNIKDLLRAGKFDIKLNGENFSIYPDYMQMLTKATPLSAEYNDLHISNSKKLVLQHFKDIMAKNNGDV